MISVSQRHTPNGRRRCRATALVGAGRSPSASIPGAPGDRARSSRIHRATISSHGWPLSEAPLAVAAHQHLPGVLLSLEPALDHYGYLAVAGFVMLEDFGVPVPGETILILGAVYAGTGRLNVVGSHSSALSRVLRRQHWFRESATSAAAP